MKTGSSVIWNKTQNESFSPVLKGVSVVLSYLVVSEKAGWRQHTWSHWSIATLNITLIVSLGTRNRMWAIKLWSLVTFNYKTEALQILLLLFSFCSYCPVRTGRGLTRLFVSTPPPTPEAVSASHIVKMRQILNPDKGIYLLPISDITVRTLEHASNLESSQPGVWRV